MAVQHGELVHVVASGRERAGQALFASQLVMVAVILVWLIVADPRGLWVPLVVLLPVLVHVAGTYLLGPLVAVTALTATVEEVTAASLRVLGARAGKITVERRPDQAVVTWRGWQGLDRQRFTVVLRGQGGRCAIEARLWPAGAAGPMRTSSLVQIDRRIVAISAAIADRPS